MVTRRDQFLKSIDDAGAAMRERMQAGGQGPQQAGPQQQGQRPEAITTQLQRGLSGLEAGFSVRSHLSHVTSSTFDLASFR